MHVYSYRLPLKTQGKFREGLLLEREGHWSEIAPLPGFSRESLEEAKQELQAWIQFGKAATLPSVRWGLACLERPLKAVNVPLCSLGPREGFSVHKLKIGALSVAEAIDYVRPYVGKVQLRLDCNRAWNLEQALAFARAFKPSDFLYLEEPVRTFEELIAFSKQTGFPVALDESISADWAKVPTLKTIVVKPMIVGGIPEVPPHLDLVLSSAYESGIGLLHIAQRATNALPIGLDTYRDFASDFLARPIDCANGVFSWTPSEPIVCLNTMQLGKIESKIDLDDARKALADVEKNSPISWEEIKRDLFRNL